VFPFENFQIMRDAISLRLDLVPYIYTAAFHTTQTGLAFLYPMYYDFPSAREAYKFTNQYKFGSLMIVAPIVTPVDKTTGLATTQIWLPDSSQGWVELGSGLRYSGDEIITRTYALSEIPVFIAEGSMIPMLGSGRKDLGAAQEQYSTLRWLVVVGQAENGAGIVYEDNPDNIDYLKGGYAETEASYTIANSIFTATILPASGSYNGMLKSRAFEFEILGLSPASTVSFDGVNIPYAGAWAGQEPPSEPGWWYDGSSLSIKVNLPGQYSTTQSHAVRQHLLA
jgi:alpha-glucosidase